MSGQPENREQGIPGGQVILDVKFFNRPQGSLVDDDRWTTESKLPVVEIYDPNGVLLEDSDAMGAPQPARQSIGDYEYTYVVPSGAAISSQYSIIWKIRINGNDVQFSELFSIVEAGDAQFGDEEFRVGFAFNNPDLTSEHHATLNRSSDIDNPDIQGWGVLVHPDELRYMVGFGNKLVSPDASQTYDDNMLYWYIDTALAMIERDLDIDILPRVIRHEDPIDSTSDGSVSGGSLAGEGNTIRIEGNRIARVDIPSDADEPNRVREPGYPYRPNQARHYLYLKLRRRPLIDVLKAVMVDPVQNQTIDLYSWRREFPGFESRLQFFPNLTAVGNYPFIPTKLLQAQYPFHDFPSAIYIDYRTGYLNAADVDIELRTALLWTAGIMLMEDFSDGKAPGIASASANLNSISESFGTTQSATNSLLGARIAYYKEHLKNWYTRNRNKYQRAMIGVL